MNYHASDRNKLQSQLNIIDRAIDLASDEKAVDSKARTGTSKLESQGVIRSLRNIENGDVSFIINTQQLELSVCPDCLQEVEQKKMKIHNLQYCGNRMVQCPSLGCGKLIHRCNLPYHLKEECLVAVTRKNLLASAAQRAAIKSDLDAQILESSQHQRHSVILQNSLFRDQEEIKMVEPKVLICSQCGEGIRESHLPDHMQRTCFFRPVACPNYTLGCGEAAISLNRIQMHLFQECNVEKRKNQMVTNSKKRNELIKCSTCGYQVELRFWKQHESEQCENRLVTCKNHPLGCSVMVPLSERNLHETLDESYERFCLYFSGHGSFLQIEESDISCPWTAEYWIYRPLPQDSLRVHLRNMLSLISSYEVAYLSEFLTWRKVMKVVNVLKDDALVSKPASRDGKKLSKAERQQIQQEQMQIKVNLINELTSLIPVYSDAALAYIRAFQQIAICIEASRDCLKELAVANHDAWNQESDLSLQTEYPGSLATISKPKTSFGETKSEKAGNVTARSLTLQEDVDRITAARTNISDSHDDFFEAVTIQAKVNQSPVAKSILFSGQSIIAQYYKICYLSLLFPQNKSQRESVDVVPGESFVQMAEKRQLEDKFVKLFGYTQLPDPTICQFLIGFLLEPITTISKFAFQPKIWKRLLETFAILLKIDFDDLQDWRIEAGLLSIDASTAATRTKLTRSPTDGVTEQIGKEVTIDMEEEMDKKRKKKEKERQRRELKKIQSRRQVEEEVDSPSSLKASKEGESENGPSFERNGNGLEMGKPERRLIERITELIKSGCGCEVLNDSNSVNQLSHRSHFCIAMYSGLSVLLETEDESGSMFSSLSSKTEKNHYYELIIPPKEFTRLAEMQGQLGFVSAFELKLEQVTEQEILLRELLGTQAVKTEAKVTRGRWSHIAFCATRQPQNRGLVYLDGNLVGNFKDSAFSLPMLSLGGSPFNIFSFSGLILDAKYWSYVRSAREIREKMHSLITLTLNKITNSAADQMLQTISPTQTTEKLSSQFTSEIPDDFGLIAWWTMDDGPGFDIVTDVTRHRFKTRIMNHVEVNYQWNGAEETKYNIPALILSELPESMLQLKNLKTFQNFVKPDTPSAENKRRIVINDKITIIDDPLLSEETAKCSPVSSHSEVEGFHKSNIVHSVQLKFDGLFEDYRETVKKGPTTSPNTRLKYQNLLQHFTQFKWIKAESVKSLVSLLAYDIPKTPQSVKALLRQESKSDVVFQDDDQPKKLEERISTIKPRKSQREKKIRKKEGKSSKLPSYLLEESINRSLDGSEVAPQTTLPIPSFREQNICPFELRRHRLARYGRELQKYVVCPLNCSQMVKKISVRFHMQFECLRRYVSCYYDGCNMIFPLNERMQHEKKDCMILQRRIQLLDEAKEKNQQILCSRCSEEIQLRHYDEHQKNECSHRMIFCPNADCSFGEVPRFRKDGQGVSARLPYHLMQHHLRFDCDSINIKHRCILIARSRNRNPYSRPWGIVIEGDD